MTEKPGLYLSMHYCFEGAIENNNDDRLKSVQKNALHSHH